MSTRQSPESSRLTSTSIDPASATAQEAGANTHEEIRTVAYQLYESHGRQDGHDLDYWLQAEEQVLGTQQKAA